MSCDTDPVVVDAKVTVVRGSDKTFDLVVTDKNGAVDLTGATVYFTVRKKVGDLGTPLVYKTSANVLQINILLPQSTLANKGRAQIFLLPTDTKYLEAIDYVYDVWVQLSSSKRYPVIAPSTFRVTSSVTVITP